MKVKVNLWHNILIHDLYYFLCNALQVDCFPTTYCRVSTIDCVFCDCGLWDCVTSHMEQFGRSDAGPWHCHDSALRQERDTATDANSAVRGFRSHANCKTLLDVQRVLTFSIPLQKLCTEGILLRGDELMNGLSKRRSGRIVFKSFPTGFSATLANGAKENCRN